MKIVFVVIASRLGGRPFDLSSGSEVCGVFADENTAEALASKLSARGMQADVFPASPEEERPASLLQ